MIRSLNHKGDTFSGRLHGHCDLYEVMSDGSKSLQNLQSFTGERLLGRVQADGPLKLHKMQNALNHEEELWPLVSKRKEMNRDQIC